MRTSRTVKVLNRTSILCRILQGPDALLSRHVEEVRLPRFACGSGEEDQPGSAAGRVVIDLEGLPQPDDPGQGMAGLPQLIAMHAEYGGEQLQVAEVPGDAERPARSPGGGGQLSLGQ
jgi:hypothetical protein